MITVREHQLDDILLLLQQIPEFDQPLPSRKEILSKTRNVPSSVLSAYVNEEPVGFKIGYERDGRFYSWLGGVVPSMRQAGVAGLLADHQEKWALEKGYTSIWMKTRNRFPQMLIMAFRRGFRLVSMIPGEDIGDHRIVLEKSL
jgi:hypothetical protein